MIRVGVAGIAGRMGSRIAQLVCEDSDMELASGWEHPQHEAVGKPLQRYVPNAGSELNVLNDIKEAVSEVDVVIDFTHPEASLYHAEICAKEKKPIVIGTTGFSSDQLEEIKKLSLSMPVVLAPNMSIGVNVLFKLVEYTAKLLGDEFDVEIIEAHHRFKKDAPSGTALKIGQLIAEAMGRNFSEVAVYERKGFTGERSRNEIGMQTIRAGDIVGEHTVIFASLGERIEITHRAHNRDNFARGAIRAAKWISGKEPGLYDMQDVLGLKNH